MTYESVLQTSQDFSLGIRLSLSTTQHILKEVDIQLVQLAHKVGLRCVKNVPEMAQPKFKVRGTAPSSVSPVPLTPN